MPDAAALFQAILVGMLTGAATSYVAVRTLAVEVRALDRRLDRVEASAGRAHQRIDSIHERGT